MGKDICNVVISFVALEIKLPDNKKQQSTQFFSMVFKRGDQQRNETEKIEHKPLKNQHDIELNRQRYATIMKNAGQSNSDFFDITYDELQYSDSITTRSSTISGIGEKNNKNLLGEIDPDRADQYTIYNIADLMGQSSYNFTRNSNFKCSMKGGVKKYEAKSAEFKVESYKSQNQQERDGVRLGHFKLNLAQFINTGLRTITYQMDKAKTIYLTAKVSVVEGNDILSMTMKAVTGQGVGGGTSNVNSKEGSVSNGLNDDDSESEEEVPGEQLMETYKHFYNVHKDNTLAAVQEQNNEGERVDTEGEVKGVSKVGKTVGKITGKVFSSAIGISSTVSGVSAANQHGDHDKALKEEIRKLKELAQKDQQSIKQIKLKLEEKDLENHKHIEMIQKLNDYLKTHKKELDQQKRQNKSINDQLQGLQKELSEIKNELDQTIAI